MSHLARDPGQLALDLGVEWGFASGAMGTSLTLAPFAHKWIGQRYRRGELAIASHRSISKRILSFVRSFGNRPIDKLGPKAVLRWQGEIGHLAPATRAAYLSSVRVFLRWMADQGHITGDPLRGVRGVQVPRPAAVTLDEPEVRAVLNACEDARDAAIAWLMVGCALRSCEVAAARWEDYDPSAGILVVHGKGAKDRFIPVLAEVHAAILTANEGRSGRHGPLIRSPWTGEGMKASTVSDRMGRLMRTAGVKHRPWDGMAGHALRRTCASDVLDNCKDLRVVMELLGHKSLKSTEHYLRRLNAEQLRPAMSGRAYRGGDAA